jgi:NADH-quinone oxidoreductase subunit M
MVYERTHTRDLRELRKLPLARLLPFAAVVFALAGIASMGMPGFSGFPAELLILAGTWKHNIAWAIAAAIGIPIAAAFTLRAIALAFFGKDNGAANGEQPDAPALAHGDAHALPAITLPEKLGAVLLLAASAAVGLFPNLLLDWITPALNSPAFKALAAAAK